ncbi:MAG TPA: prepilin-type N-terminal cleavage/methylation domain-containing protein [Candidatus Acidoferrales bacterium]|nr:prepilin-type N-terminal cleavage/methylation domain-containing protein [Candidatus Acidoferrales bacterium]
MKAIRNSKGFTLIELLVVVAIIGILAAIAIPQFAAYRQRGFDSRAASDLRNAATGEEANFATNQAYISCTNPCGTLPGFKQSNGVTMSLTAATQSFTGTSTHTQGTGKTWNYDSAGGGLS